MDRTRAVVLGAGIVGAACARELALAGFDVLVLDRGGAAAATTSHGEGNVLVSDKSPGPELELARLSRRLWPEILDALAGRTAWAAAVPRRPSGTQGGIVVATTEQGAAGLLRFAATQRAAGVTAEELDPPRCGRPNRSSPGGTPRRCATRGRPGTARRGGLRPARRRGRRRCRTAHRPRGARRRGPRRTADVRALRRGDRGGGAVPQRGGPVVGGAGRPARRAGGHPPRRGEVLVTTPLPPTVFHKVYDADYVSAVGSGDEGLRTSAVVEATRGERAHRLLAPPRRVRRPDAPEVLSAVAAKALRLFPPWRTCRSCARTAASGRTCPTTSRSSGRTRGCGAVARERTRGRGDRAVGRHRPPGARPAAGHPDGDRRRAVPRGPARGTGRSGNRRGGN
ncbi:FAD-dependent oxidoreductase [Streptomyces sp. M19]